MGLVKIGFVFGKSRGVLEVAIEYFMTGDVESVRIETTTVNPAAKDPSQSHSHAMSLLLRRPEGDVQACSGRLGNISKKPSHGVLSGKDALGMAIGHL